MKIFMYKNLTTALAALLLIAASCTSKREYFTAQDYDRILIEEFHSIRDTAPKVVLYESMIVMDTIAEDGARLSEFINVFREGDHFTFSYHFPDTTVITHFEDQRDDFVGFAPDTLHYGLAKVLNILRSDINGGVNISLYSMMGQQRLYPPYFTVETEEVEFYVDATTGKVDLGHVNHLDEEGEEY